MTRFTLTAAVLAALTAPALSQDSPAKKVEGTYTIKAMSTDGKAVPAEVLATLSEARITATELVIVHASGQEDKTTVRFDTKAAAIDLLPAADAKGEKPRLGIYKLENDDLTVVVGPADGTRPTDIKGDAAGTRVMVFTRKK